MPYVKNQAGQVLYFYAFDANGDPVTGDAANLSGKISLDGGAWSDLSNSISEDAYGWYKVTLSQAETNANMARVRIVSTTAGVRVNPIIVHFTTLTETRTGYLDAAISSRASQTSVDAIPTNPVLANDSRLDYLDTSVSSRASQTSVNAIPTNPLLTTDARLNNLDAAISSRASQDSVNAIPTNPLLANDARLNNLDAPITSRSTLTAAQVWEYATRTLTSFGSLVTDIWSYATRTLSSFGSLIADIWGHANRSLTDKEGFSLAADQPVNVTKVGGVSVSGPNDLKADVSGLALEATAQSIKAKIDILPSDIATQEDVTGATTSILTAVNAIPTNPLLAIDPRLDNLDIAVSTRAAPGDAMTLTSAYDAAKTAASQASVDAIPTNPVLATDSRLDCLDAAVSSRASQASVDAIPTNPLLANDIRLNHLDAAISSRAVENNGRLQAIDARLPAEPASKEDVNGAKEELMVAIASNTISEDQIIRAMWSRFEYNRETKRFTVYDLSGNPLVTGTIDKTATGSQRRPD